ncbi:MAG: substrate-binding domain-containing protein [Anaerolineae bacterium]|nr:substrate-binding domain-containing protein [Anaerolineae bacterium]
MASRTIGFLTSGISDDISRDMWTGLVNAAQQRDVTVFTFVGGFLRDPTGFAAQSNIIYNVASGKKLDGLITWASSVGGLVDTAEVIAFHRRYHPLPMVSMALPLPGIPSPMLDSYQGLRELLAHLIEGHGYRRLAFVRGPETHYSAQERYRAYLDALQEYGIPFDPHLVSAELGWTAETGAEAVRLFLDERRFRPGLDLHAIVAASDTQALAALRALQARGIRVPQDLALTGVNDNRAGRVATPPLTTVALPFYQLGETAVETLLALVEGETVGPLPPLQGRPIIRESCGCADRDVAAAVVGGGGVVSRPPASPLDIHAHPAAAAMALAMHRFSSPDVDSQARDVASAFLADVQTEAGLFLDALNEALDRARASRDVAVWQRGLSVLRREMVPHLRGAERQRAEDLLQQARVLTAKRTQRLEAYHHLQTEQQAHLLYELGARMTTASDSGQLMDALAEGLPRLGIPSGLLALYEQPQLYQYPWPAPDYARLMLGYDDKGRIGVEAEGRRFPTQHLAPDGLLPREPRSYVVEPLHFQDQQLGVAVLEMGPRDGALYETLRVQISSALRGVQLSEQNVSLYRQALEGQQAAQEGQRLAEEANLLKSRFLSMVSHELLTPLVLLVGLSEMMLREGARGREPLPDPYRQDLRRIHVSARQLSSLVRDVTDLARSEVGQLRLVQSPVDLADVLRGVGVVGEQMAREKGLQWRVEIPSTLPPVVGDAARLHQVALNLVANAVKFTQRGHVALRVQQDEHGVTVLISDTGLGVPIGEQGAIFDQFRQSERTVARGFGGLGIGLALCQHIVEMHGGQIGVRSSGEENAGSTFYFTLPIGRDGATQDARQPSLSQTVLILTEHAGQVARLRDYLRQRGYDVEVLPIRERSDWLSVVLASPPGALVLDSPAAKLGWELIAPLKENPTTQDIPLLFYSLDQDEDAGAMLALDYLSKPIGIAALAHTLKRYGLGEGAQANTILVVDDDPGILEMHSQMIQAIMPTDRVLQASNGRLALDSMRRVRPSLVLLDLMMPELDGFGVLEAMQADASLRDIPVIVLTAQVLTQTDMARLNQGVTTVLSKGLLTTEETLAHIERSLAHSKKLGSDVQRVVRKVMAYIHEHYADPLSRDELADYAGVSPRHLTRCFDEEVGISPITYLNRFRILEAKRLLVRGDKSITEVAIEVGFSNSAYFAEMFRRETGVSPRDFQRREPGPSK